MPTFSLRTALTLMIVGVISNSLWAQTPAFEATTVNITAWNLAGFNAIPRRQAETFTDAITYLDPEILVLVEVNPDFFPAEIVAELGDRGLVFKRAIRDQSARQNIAILYKQGVVISNVRLVEDSDNNNSSLRKALAADVRVGEFDFILLALHLKAGRGSINRGIRDNQVQAIASFINTATAGTEKDMLVVGDYNMIPVEDQSNFENMSPNSFLTFISDELAGQFSHIGSGGPGNLLDGFAISAGHTAEYVEGSLQIIPLHDVLGLTLLEYRNTVSDHLPLNAVFRITEDDDQP